MEFTESMAEPESSTVLERKLAVSETDRGNGRSALRALRLALARTAKDLFDLPLAVIGAKQARIEKKAAKGFLADDRLLVVLDGSQGQAGAVSLDRACVAALTQQQTMGLVTGAEAAEREYTGTDAALAEPLIEMLLSRATALSDSADDQRCLGGFRFGALIENVRSLMLVFDTERYRVFDLTIDIAEGAMQGAICLILPDLPADTDADGTGAGPSLDQGFGVMRADLTASIGKMRIPLAELAKMTVGDLLPLTRERLEETQLITIEGKPVAAGRLGQINGLRAVRLNESQMPVNAGGMATEIEFAASVADTTGPDPMSITMPGNAAMPGGDGLPDLPSMADLPAMGGPLPDLPAMGSPMGDLPDLPPLPDLPMMGDALPDLPDLPSLPDLPAMSGLPDESGDDALAHMTPEQAALEITQLAGLDDLVGGS